jgi:glycosyltransferase involved in cell wall biosynthesis
VIGFDSGATPEIVKDGETGILYRDREGLKNALKTLIRDAKQRKEMGHAGYRRAVQMFSGEANTAAIRELYRSLDKGEGE